jgi:hypothetical protein
MKKILLFVLCFTGLLVVIPDNTLFGSSRMSSQDDSTKVVSLSLNADLVSRYIWRGLPLDLNANIQPYASLSFKNFTIGTWGSYSVTSTYAEVDLYLSYDIGPFSLLVSDYFNEDETDMSLSDYFRFSDTDTSNTYHSLEGQVTFNGTDNFPISLSLATFFYGNDKNDEGKNYYSTYFELGYEHSIGENSLAFFLGSTFTEGYYAKKAGIVNIGLTASREIKISETSSLPVSASFIVNPIAKDVFLVFSLTF